MIYFIQDQTACLVKIGWTEGDPENRLKALQTGSPAGLVLLATMPGDRPAEGELHKRFHSAWSHGEWFRPVPELILFILAEQQQQVIQLHVYSEQSHAKVLTHLARLQSETESARAYIDGFQDASCLAERIAETYNSAVAIDRLSYLSTGAAVASTHANDRESALHQVAGLKNDVEKYYQQLDEFEEEKESTDDWHTAASTC